MVSDLLLFWSPWFKYRFIKIDLVTEGKFCFNFSCVLGGMVDCVNVNPSVRARSNPGLRDAQKVCALTKVSTVLNIILVQEFCPLKTGIA